MNKDNTTDKIVSLPSKRIEEGSNVRLKCGSPTMTVASIRTIYTCSFFDSNTGEYADHQFYEHEIEIDNKKIN